SGHAAMLTLLSRTPHLDAVFAANDLMARGALNALQESGKRVPQDIAIAGFDDSPIASATDPALTTMRQPFERISQEMVRLLISVIDGETAATVTLPTTLVIRESTTANPSPAGEPHSRDLISKT